MTAELDELKSALLGLLPMAPDNEKRLWQKFRLEWNFHSNHIEGNTLTYGETELFFLHDRIQAGHTHREYVEMKAHDAAIEHVRELAKEARIIGEGDIRNLNKIALKEPFWKDAITAEGQPTKKQVIPGEYKTTPNNVLTATGETFFFARPEETAPKMQEFVAWLAQELASGTSHPVEIAAKCHHDFVLIHPFDDGNGRVARLLVNYVLLRAGFPPVIIRTEKKGAYLAALQQADSGDLLPLTNHFIAELRWSLETSIKAAKGENIEELSDAEKELALFVRQQTSQKRDVVPKSPETLREIYALGWRGLFESFEKKMLLLSKLFATAKWNFQPQHPNSKDWRTAFEAGVEKLGIGHPLNLAVELGGYHGESKNPFNYQCTLSIVVQEFEYEVIVGTAQGQKQVLKKLYSEPIPTDEAERITSGFLKSVFDEIKTKATGK